jgi:hypothetical protein
MFAIIFKFLSSLWVSKSQDHSQDHGSLNPPALEPDTSGLYASGKVVSVIHNSAVGPSVVVIQTLVDDSRPAQMLSGATGYRFLGAVPDPGSGNKRFLKSIRKNTSALEKLCCILQSETKGMPVNAQQSSTGVRDSIKIGQGVFISNPELEDKEKDSDMTEIYTKIALQFSNGVSSTQYFNSRCSTIKPAFLSRDSPVRFKRIDINTGMCLFSKAVLSASPGHGQSINDDEKLPIPPLPRNHKPTAYELEIITRLSFAIADVVGLIGEPHRSRNTPVAINIDIPDLQYYWTACELFERGLVTIDYVQSWIAMIDKRRKQLKNILTSTIRAMLLDRHLCDIDIHITPGTEPAVELVKKSVAIGAVPCLEELVGALRSQGENGVRWREFLDNLDPRHQPSTVEELGRLMYIFKTVRPALEHHQPPVDENNDDMPGRKLVIQVDDVNEWKVLDKSQAFLKKYSKRLVEDEAILVGLFPMQRIFAAGKGRTDLYVSDPGHRLCLDVEQTKIGLLDVISATYGTRVAKRLQFLCQREEFEEGTSGLAAML